MIARDPGIVDQDCRCTQCGCNPGNQASCSVSIVNIQQFSATSIRNPCQKVGDHLYGMGQRELICMDYKTGEIAWSDRSVGKGSLIYADGMLYCLGEKHTAALVEADPSGYRERGRFRIDRIARQPSWAHFAIADGVLYLRNWDRLTAYAIRAR